jgi:ubiquinol-cytochrome c reductase cytochrome c subunit
VIGPRRAPRRGGWLALVLLVAGLGIAVVEVVEPADAQQAIGSTPGGVEGRTRFESDCAVCHGNSGRGSSRGPSLVNVGAASLDFWLSTGRMPLASPSDTPQRHPPAYRPSTIRALIAYVQYLTGSGGPPIPQVNLAGADLGAGGVSFRLQCAACHSWAGEGGALVSRAAPATNQATPTQIFEAIRIGPGAMPRFGQAALTDREVKNVVAYVRYLAHPFDRGGEPLGRIGPLAEGAAALFIGLGLLVLASRWIGTRG